MIYLLPEGGEDYSFLGETPDSVLQRSLAGYCINGSDHINRMC